MPVIEVKKGPSNDPTDENSPANQVLRRIVCGRMGKAKFVSENPDHSAGRFMQIDRQTIVSMLEDPITHSLYFHDYVLPFALEYHETEDLVKFFQNPKMVANQLHDDTLWAAKVLCGLSAALPGEEDAEDDAVAAADLLVEQAHEATPEFRSIRVQHINKAGRCLIQIEVVPTNILTKKQPYALSDISNTACEGLTTVKQQ